MLLSFAVQAPLAQQYTVNAMLSLASGVRACQAEKLCASAFGH